MRDAASHRRQLLTQRNPATQYTHTGLITEYDLHSRGQTIGRTKDGEDAPENIEPYLRKRTVKVLTHQEQICEANILLFLKNKTKNNLLK